VIPSLPAASAATPPADRIADPVTSTATCGDWHQQTKYGDRWQTSSTWWEYQCTATDSQYHNTCPGPMCDAFCPTCWTETHTRIDYFYWDGAKAVFYGQSYSAVIQYDGGWLEDALTSHWWDGPSTQWYDVGSTT
jgi:hypothetical protein